MFLLCESQSRKFAIPLSSIKEIVPLPYLQDAPFQGKGYIGTLNYRGNFVPVFDASEILFNEPLPIDLNNKVVIVDYLTDIYGFMVGDVRDSFEHESVVSSGQENDIELTFAVAGEEFIPILSEDIIKKAIKANEKNSTARFCPASKEAAELFAQRSRALFADVRNDEDEEKEFLLARLNREFIAFEDEGVSEVVEAGVITAVPGADEIFSGLFSLRGELITVVNLSKLLFKQRAELSKLSRIVVVQMKHEKVGLLVEELKDLVVIKQAEIRTPHFVDSVLMKFSKGQFDFGSSAVNILDIEKIIEEITQKTGG